MMHFLSKYKQILTCLASLFFFLTLYLALPHNAFAAITLKWKDKQTLEVSGDVKGTLTEVTPGSNSFFGKVTGKCDSLVINVDASGTKATLAKKPTGPGSGNPGETPCFADDPLNIQQDQPIQGVRPGTNPTETKEQKKVHVVLESQKRPEDSPETVTFTITDSTGKVVAKTPVKKVLQCQGFGCDATPPTQWAEYSATYYLGPGKYKICFAPALEPCANFTKEKYVDLGLHYGQAWYFATILVNVEVSYSILLGQTCRVKGYEVDLKQGDKILQTIKTKDGKRDAKPAEKETLGGSADITIGMDATFTNVKPGKYKVCLHGTDTCVDVEKPQGDISQPSPVRIEVEGKNTASACKADKPSLPPPPSPPCAKYEKSKCVLVVTAFGNIETAPTTFVSRIYGIVLAFSGGIAILLLMRAGYRIMTSQGNQEALKDGREQATAAIVGLIFLIFAFVVLQLIAYDLLRIPGVTP